MKKLLSVLLVGVMMFSLVACNNEKTIFKVSEDLCFKEGDGLDSATGKQVLINTDIVDVSFREDSEKEDIFDIFFTLTKVGQDKLYKASKEISEEDGSLSLWIGEEFISSAQLSQPINQDAFVMEVSGITDDNRNSFMKKIISKSEY